MPVSKHYLATFSQDGIYHVYNRTNNKEPLFLDEENFEFFLDKYLYYVSPFAETLAWCLLANHFHLIIRIKKKDIIKSFLSGLRSRKQTATELRFLKDECTIHELVNHAFRRLFQCYAQSFNKYYRRKGNLFYRPFKRVRIKEPEHFTQTVIYIHTNPVKHGLAFNFRTYPWSSYLEYINNCKGLTKKDPVWKAFGSMKTFRKEHERWEKEWREGLSTLKG